MRTRIKICGICDAEHARIAAHAGADAIGLVFHRASSRALELEQAARIAHACAPFVASVAVLVDPPAEYVREIIARVAPTYLQFHGDEPPEFCAAFSVPFIKALRIGARKKVDARAFETRYATARAILFDTAHAHVAGGGGETFDWAHAKGGAQLPRILAGGLHAGNVGGAVAEVTPFAVDVSSGVESNARKDAKKIHAFCNAVRAADARVHSSRQSSAAA